MSSTSPAKDAPSCMLNALPKAPTGIQGFDEITDGGLPKGRTTLICGGPGSGKTLFGVEFLARGAGSFDEPGVFVSFEETARDLIANVVSLGFDLADLIERRLLFIDDVQIEKSELAETGEYDLDGLFVRLGHAISTVKAKRVVLDTIESLFGAISSEGRLRAELRRLFRWLKDQGVTTIVTGERGDGTLTRHGLEEYVSDCVIVLDQKVYKKVVTRRIRIVKYRGSSHGMNEYPFIVHERGLSVLPITSLTLDHPTSTERLSLGIPRLDSMLSGGVYRGASVLISGTAGTGKSSIAAAAVHAACQRGERCLYFAFEESQGQILRNMKSIGIDLMPWIASNVLRIHAARPTLFGLERHLVNMYADIDAFRPAIVVVDPVSNLCAVGNRSEVNEMLARLIDFMKSRAVTAFLISLASGDDPTEGTEVGISSIMDTWLLLRSIDSNAERNRCLYILKSRGTAHSNQVREFVMSDRGIDLVDVYRGPSGVVTGTARLALEATERAASVSRRRDIERKQRDISRKRRAIEAQIGALRVDLEAEDEQLRALLDEETERGASATSDQTAMGRLRQADAKPPPEAAHPTAGDDVQRKKSGSEPQS